jgi:hypothetical protein
MAKRCAGTAGVKAAVSFTDKAFRYVCARMNSERSEILDSFSGPMPLRSTSDLGSAPRYDFGSLFADVAKMACDVRVPIAVALPEDDSFVRVVSFPGLSLDDAKRAFRYEFERYFPILYEDGCFDMAEIYCPKKLGGNEKNFLAAASFKSLVSDIAVQAGANGLNVDLAEPARISVERNLTSSLNDDGAHLYIRASSSSVQLTAIYRRTGIYYREMMASKTAPDGNSEEWEAFMKEFAYSVNTLFAKLDGFTPQDAYITSSEAVFRWLKDSLASAGVSKSVFFDPLDFWDSGSRGFDEDWHAVLGLLFRCDS